MIFEILQKYDFKKDIISHILSTPYHTIPYHTRTKIGRVECVHRKLILYSNKIVSSAFLRAKNTCVILRTISAPSKKVKLLKVELQYWYDINMWQSIIVIIYFIDITSKSFQKKKCHDVLLIAVSLLNKLE